MAAWAQSRDFWQASVLILGNNNAADANDHGEGRAFREVLAMRRQSKGGRAAGASSFPRMNDLPTAFNWCARERFGRLDLQYRQGR
jgi:hypothetical protein